MTPLITIIIIAIIARIMPVANAAAAMIPFHANATTAGGWQCNDGFFRTSPALPEMATCKRCSTPPCSPGNFLSRCTPTKDTICLPCPQPPPENARYIQGGCTQTACLDGYYYHHGQNAPCEPCPVGSFCAGGNITACDSDATTIGTGASAVLQCLPKDLSNGSIALVISIDFSFTQQQPMQAACAGAPLRRIIEWIPYGRFGDCTLRFYDTFALAGAVQCGIFTSKSAGAGGVFVNWLLKQLRENQQLFLLDSLQRCLRTTALVITSTSITSGDAAVGADSSNLMRGPQDPPQLRYDDFRWGHQPKDVIAALAALGILCTTLPLAIAIICAGLYVKTRRRQEMHRFLVRRRQTLPKL
jgi:hypothetical protein